MNKRNKKFFNKVSGCMERFCSILKSNTQQIIDFERKIKLILTTNTTKCTFLLEVNEISLTVNILD